MHAIQNIEEEEEVKKKFTELHQELGDKLKYSVDELVEIFNGLRQDGYTINGFLGSGAEGPVFSVTNNGNQIAVKVISSKDASKIENELTIMEKFKNQPYIHQCTRSFYSENKKYFFYLTEKLTCDLESIMLTMKNRKQKFSYNQIVAFMIQMTTALSILESNKVIHSDLKPANILYDQKNKCFKISDYGFSKVIVQKLQQSIISATRSLNGGNLKYTAPEVWKQNQDYTCKIDVFSLGLILLELAHGKLNMHEVMEISTGGVSVSNYLNEEQYSSLNELIPQMLIADRRSRISASDLLQKLKQLQNEEESSLFKQLDQLDMSGYLRRIRVDELTLQNMEQSLEQLKQLYSSSLTQVNLDGIVADSSKRIIFMRYLKFKDKIKTLKQLTEFEEALSKYRKEATTSLGVRVIFSGSGYDNELATNLGPSVVASRIASALEGCCQSITTLNLGFWRLKIGSEGSKSLVAAIEKCSQNLLVVGLGFYQCEIGPDEIRYLSQSLEKCEQMTTLGLHLYDYSNKMGSTGASYLASSLQKCKSLTELTLSLGIQSASDQGLISIGQALGNCKKLTRLNMEQVFCNDKSIEEFGSSLAKCPNLITLNVNLNYTPLIAPNLPLFAQLTTLALYLHSYDQNNIESLCMSLNQCSNLTSLCLELYEWSLDNAISLVEGLEKSNLTTLKLVFKYIKFPEKQEEQQQQSDRLGKSLSRFQKLTSLYIFFDSPKNNPTYFISTLLSQQLAKCQNLTTLSLGLAYSKIASSDAKLIGQSLEKCKYLQTLNLYLWKNNIKSEGALAISESLQKCTNLKDLEWSIIENYCCDYIAHPLVTFMSFMPLTSLLSASMTASQSKHTRTGHTKHMDSVAPRITSDLKQCKNLRELKVGVKSGNCEDDKWEIKFGVLTAFEADFFD